MTSNQVNSYLSEETLFTAVHTDINHEAAYHNDLLRSFGKQFLQDIIVMYTKPAKSHPPHYNNHVNV